LLLGVIFLTHQKFWLKESDYFSENMWEDFANIKFDESIENSHPSKSIILKDPVKNNNNLYSIISSPATIVYKNISNSVITYDLKYIFKNLSNQKISFTLLHNNKPIKNGVIPALYDPLKYFHDYKANNLLLNLPLEFIKGENEIKIEFKPISNVRRLKNKNNMSNLYLYDLTLSNKKEFYNFINKEFIIGDQADVREALNLIKALKKHVYLFEQTGNEGLNRKTGTFIITNFPLYYYIVMFISFLANNSIMTLNLLFILFLSFIVLISKKLISKNKLLPWQKLFIYVILLIVSLNYILLISRWGLESLYEDTLLALFFLVFLYFFNEKNMFLTCIYAVFASLTKSYGIILILLAIFIYTFVEKDKRFLIKFTLIFSSLSFSILIIYLIFALKHNLLKSWISEVKYENLERFILLKLFLKNKIYIISIFFKKLWNLFSLMFWCGGFLGIWFFLNIKRRSEFLLIPVIFIILLSILNGFRSYYLSAVIFLPVILGASSILSLQSIKTRRIVVFLSVLFVSCSLFLSLRITSDYTAAQKNKVIIFSQTVYDKVDDYLRRKGQSEKADAIFINKNREKELNHEL